MPEVQRGSLGAHVPGALPDELVEVLARWSGGRIERIVSRGHVTPEGEWYDQPEDEFVLLVSGAARLAFEDGVTLDLAPGDWLELPAHLRHRVEWTSADTDTVWLAVFHTSED
jgi:cupin 2 domain-containing protein